MGLWRKLSLLLLLSFLALSALHSAEDPENMTDKEILQELSAISARQQMRWATLDEKLPLLQRMQEQLQTELETQQHDSLKLQQRLQILEPRLLTAEKTLEEKANSLESSLKDMEKELRATKGWNIALMVLGAVATGTAITLLLSR